MVYESSPVWGFADGSKRLIRTNARGQCRSHTFCFRRSKGGLTDQGSERVAQKSPAPSTNPGFSKGLV